MRYWMIVNRLTHVPVTHQVKDEDLNPLIAAGRLFYTHADAWAVQLASDFDFPTVVIAVDMTAMAR